MTDIAGIEARIDAALGRIAEGIGRLPKTPTAEETKNQKADNAEYEAKIQAAEKEANKLRAELDDEKKAHAQLTERVKAIREKQDETVDQLEKRVLKLQEQANTQANDLARLGRVNSELRATIKALRDAAAEGMVEAEGLNQAMKAELDATRVQQSVDRSELDMILTELTPLIQEKADV